MDEKLKVCVMTPTDHAKQIAECVSEEEIRHTLSTLWLKRPQSELDVKGIDYWMSILKMALEIQAGKEPELLWN